MTKKKKNILAIEREESKTPSTRQCRWVTLIYFIYFILSCTDEYSKAQEESVDPLDFKK
jgi:preprotein translocase subunit SecY